MTRIEEQIALNLNAVHQEIEQAAKAVGRNPEDIQLLAVSKTHPASSIEAAYKAGQQDFGENYLQEALDKIRQLTHLNITWHFIGRIQSNKTRPIAENFSWIHTLDSYKHAHRISDQRPKNLDPVNVCIQVNISNEASKAGVSAGQVSQLAGEISALPGIKLRGLMAIPEASNDIHIQRQAFSDLAALLKKLNTEGFNLDTLSMGMSADLAVAIEEGSTIVRIGTAIFGQRTP